MHNELVVSIVTPTYNRANLLDRCFESLKSQTCKGFEWIIVDDGSTDNTEEVVGEFLKEITEFKITYVKKKNGGKHTALNESHKYITGNLVLILDSDDYLTEDAVEIVLAGWEKYCKDPEVGVVTFLRGKTKDEPLAYANDENVKVDLLRYKRVCVHSSDCCEVIRAELFNQFPFPMYEGERFMAETVLWYRVGWEHKCVYINKVVYICEYLDGGLTASGRKMRIKNPYGGMLNSELGMDGKNYFKFRVKNGLLYVCYGFFAGLGPIKILKKDEKYRLLKTICLLPGYFMYRKWKSSYMEG